MDMLSVRRLRYGIDKDISDSKIGADMDMLPVRRRAWSLRALPSSSATAAGIDKDISAWRRCIDPMDISASRTGADMDMLSVRRLRDGTDNDIPSSRRGIDPMDISASSLRDGMDNDNSSSRRGIDFMDAEMSSAAVEIESRRNLFARASTDLVLTKALS